MGRNLLLGASLVLVGGRAFSVEKLPSPLTMLTGCFKVQFNYLEQGSTVAPAYQVQTYEWIKYLPEKEGFHLQHYAIVQAGKDTHTFVHWGEQWKGAKGGQWDQTVFLNKEGKRYACSSPFQSRKVKGRDGKEILVAQRVCRAKACPKPTRHRSRKDYDKLDRNSTVNITPSGWRDVQQNVLRDKDGKAVATEVAWNEYTRVDKSHCAAARKEYGE